MNVILLTTTSLDKILYVSSDAKQNFRRLWIKVVLNRVKSLPSKNM